MKLHVYKGETLHDVLVTLKIDGVRAHGTEDGVVSRAGKPLHNVRVAPGAIAEVFCGSWEASVSAVRTHNGDPVASCHVYQLFPEVDCRLVVHSYKVAGPELVAALFAQAKADGYEGLVLHCAEGLFKVKGTETYDETVTEVIPGKGKHTGRMGALMTSRGKVGTGFTDAVRSEGWHPGMVIEVTCMELTPSGKFRHPRFIRRRYDKEPQ